MFCEQSGDCELQSLAYHYQMDNIRFKETFSETAGGIMSSSYIAIDHNRCVVCGRCIRACREVAAVRTLDFGGAARKQWSQQILISRWVNLPALPAGLAYRLADRRNH